MSQKGMSFVYDGIPSENYGLYIGELGSSDTKSDMASTNLEVVLDNVSNRCENFVYGIKPSERTLKFKINLFSYDTLTREDIAYIDQWLFNKHDFKELMICQDDMLKFKYKAIIRKSDILSHGNAPYGFECEVFCDSLYAYESSKSKVYTIDGITKIRFNNLDNGYGYLYPNISFICNKENGTVRIMNKSDDNREFVINGLKQGESISIDKWCQIESSLDLYRIGNCNKQFVRFVDGINFLEVEGNLTRLEIGYQFKRAIGS